MTDEELVQKYKDNDDQQALTTLLNRHKKKLKFFLLRFVEDEDTAQDLVQQTHIRVFDKVKDHYDGKGKYVSWLYTVARNIAYDYLRYEKRFWYVQGFMEDDNEDESYFDMMESDTVNADYKLEVQERFDEVMEVFDQLPKEQKDVVIMRVKYDMKFKDIAEVLDEPVNTILGRMRYARNNMKTLLNGGSYEKQKK